MSLNESEDGRMEENWMEECILISPFYVLKIDKEGTVLYANERGRSLLKVLKSGVGEITPVELQDILQRVNFRRKSEQMELNAGERIYSITFSPLLSEECTILSASDITPFKETEEKLRE